MYRKRLHLIYEEKVLCTMAPYPNRAKKSPKSQFKLNSCIQIALIDFDFEKIMKEGIKGNPREYKRNSNAWVASTLFEYGNTNSGDISYIEAPNL